jgi:hypothetical protein
MNDRPDLRPSNPWILGGGLLVSGLLASTTFLFGSISADVESIKSAYAAIRYTASVLFAGCGIWLGFMYPSMRQRVDDGEVLSDARLNLFRILLEVLGFAALIFVALLCYTVANSFGLSLFKGSWGPLVELIALWGVVFLSFVEACCLCFVAFPIWQIWHDIDGKSEENRSKRSTTPQDF